MFDKIVSRKHFHPVSHNEIQAVPKRTRGEIIGLVRTKKLDQSLFGRYEKRKPHFPFFILHRKTGKCSSLFFHNQRRHNIKIARKVGSLTVSLNIIFVCMEPVSRTAKESENQNLNVLNTLFFLRYYSWFTPNHIFNFTKGWYSNLRLLNNFFVNNNFKKGRFFNRLTGSVHSFFLQYQVCCLF